MYYSHNVHFIAVSRMEQGRYAEAILEANRLAENVRAAVSQMQMLEGYMPIALFVQLRFNKWEEVLKDPEPAASMLMTRALWHYARALAFIGKGDLEKAATERQRFEETRKAVPPEHIFTPNNPAMRALELPDDIIDARMAAAKQNHTAAIEQWRAAVAAQDALSYEEPPPWYFPTREALGVALLRAGQHAEAETVLRENLRRNPRNGRALFALWQCLKSQHRSDEAAMIEAQFREAWRGAEVQLRIEDF
jgi:tetratricopeptide (TPR) repeat protein